MAKFAPYSSHHLQERISDANVSNVSSCKRKTPFFLPQLFEDFYHAIKKMKESIVEIFTITSKDLTLVSKI